MTAEQLAETIRLYDGRRLNPASVTLSRLEDRLMYIDRAGRIYLRGMCTPYTADSAVVLCGSGTGGKGADLYIGFRGRDSIVLRDAEDDFLLITGGETYTEQQAMSWFSELYGPPEDYTAADITYMIALCSEASGIRFTDYSFDGDGYFTLCGCRMPYNSADFVSVKYLADSDAREGYIKLETDTGDILKVTGHQSPVYELTAAVSPDAAGRGTARTFRSIEEIRRYFEEICGG